MTEETTPLNELVRNAMDHIVKSLQELPSGMYLCIHTPQGGNPLLFEENTKDGSTNKYVSTEHIISSPDECHISFERKILYGPKI